MEENKSDLIKLIIGSASFIISIFLKGSVHYIFLIISYITLIYEIIIKATKNILNGMIFDENTLMLTASAAAAILGEFNEAVLVILLYDIGEFAQDLATDKSREKIINLINLTPSVVHLDTGDVEPNKVEIGTVFTVYPGERVSLDGEIVKGQAFLDTKTITGESVPIPGKVGTKVISGTIILDSKVSIRATKRYSDSTLHKLIHLIEESEEAKAPTEKFITKFASIYTPVIVILGVLIAIIPSLITSDWHTWVYRALNFIVISCPCALVLSIPLTFFAGIGSCSASGILVKGANTLETLSKTKAFVFDKTGTITNGNFIILKIYPADGVTKEYIMEKLYSVEKSSKHPIAKAVTDYCQLQNIICKIEYNVSEAAGMGLIGKNGCNTVLAGNSRLLKSYNVKFDEIEESGTVVYVAENNRFLGCVIIGDTIKPNAAKSIEELKKLGIRKTVMLSGDSENKVKTVSKEVGIEDCYANLMPEDKKSIIEELQKSFNCTYCGDGVNDIPVMLVSDTSISMGKTGSDAAIEASDIVFTNEDLTKLPKALKTARKTVSIAKQNIILAIGVKLICMTLGTLGFSNLSLSVFADSGVALLAVLNSLRALY